MENPSKHRLKQKDLVMNIFGFFSEEYDRSDVGSIWDIIIPIDKVINNLEEKCNVSYKSDIWVWQQLKRYEEELGVKLFKKIKSVKDPKKISLSMNYPYINFFQKQHLYVNEKIRVANGVFDKIQEHIHKNRNREEIKIFLGGGTLCYHLSTIFAQKSWQNKTKYFIYTNNLGVLNQLIAPSINHDNIIVSIPEGNIDFVTYTIIGERTGFYTATSFDFVIQGTSIVHNDSLFIESLRETKRKEDILLNSTGQKILALTTHEFSINPLDSSTAYGKIDDYDYVVVPKKSVSSSKKKKHEILFEESKKNLTPEIINWNYEIYKVNE